MSLNKTKNRNSTVHGEFRHKRSDTLVRTLRQEYGEHFAQGFPGDAKLQDVLRKAKVQSLSEYVRRLRPIYIRNRFASAMDTARVLGVPKARAESLIKLAKQSLSAAVIERARNGTHAEPGSYKSKTTAVPVVSAAKKKPGSTHGEFKVKKAKTKR